MKVCVIANDPEVHAVCREAMTGLGQFAPNVTVVGPERASEADGDVLIWDWEAVSPFFDPETTPLECGRQIFIVSRNDLHDFIDKMPLGPGSTILKPVSRTTLRIFLNQAPKSIRRRGTGSADRQDLLQYVLEANLRLQEYDQDRTNFLARAVHDFRAPLTSTAGYCGLLLDQSLGQLNGQQVEVLHRMERSLKKLTRMADAMFQLSIGKQVDRVFEFQDANIETAIRNSCEEIASIARQRGIMLRLQITPPRVPLYFAPLEIEQTMVNLLENACKFTPKGGQIEVIAYPMAVRGPAGEDGAESGYRIDVSDTGTGIQEQHLESVFEEYTSYSGSADRSGGGLGLAICRMIVTAHGGKIWAENLSQGARISFVLPSGTHRRTVAPVTVRREAC